MQTVVDSFVEYLATELADAPPVHWVRVSPDEDSNRPKVGYLNITVLGFLQNGQMEEALVSLDLIGTDERATFVWAKAVRDKLLERQYTAELDYAANPSSPVDTGKMVEWRGNDIDFRVLVTDVHYVHLNATFPLRHARQ